MLDIKSTIRPAPFLKGAGRLPFEEMTKAVLSDKYQLSLVLCGDTLARRINVAYRKKTYSPNVLSFPLDTHEGEIFLNVRKAEREARQFGVPARERIALLFVHGLFHLKGMGHGDKMEAAEQKILRAFKIAR